VHSDVCPDCPSGCQCHHCQSRRREEDRRKMITNKKQEQNKEGKP
jgi:hypothetical protein